MLALSSPGSGVVCKEYGKAKIYFIDQSTMTSSFSPAQLEKLQIENEQLKTKFDTLSSEERNLKSELQKLLDEPTDDELSRLIIVTFQIFI